MGKTKVMRCVVSNDQSVQAVDAVKWPYGVCRKRVGQGSILCRSCKKWVHHRCTGVKGVLKDDANFQCSVCIMGDHRNAEHEKEVVVDDAGSVEWVDNFCYLGDMMGCGVEWRMRSD